MNDFICEAAFMQDMQLSALQKEDYQPQVLHRKDDEDKLILSVN